MSDDENRKATLPGDSVLAEVIRVSIKLDEMKRANADDKVAIIQRITHLESRVELVETNGKRDSEVARKALKSYSDLSEHVQSTEAAMKASFDNLNSGFGHRMSDAEMQLAALTKETKAQTPMLQKLESMLAEQNAYEKAKDKMKREAAEAAAEKAKRDNAERVATSAAHKRRMAYAGVGLAFLGIIVPAIMSYLGTKQANQDAPPKTVVVHEGH